MRRAVVLVALCLCAGDARAQTIGTNIEIMGDGGFLGGVTPISFKQGSQALTYGGAQGSVGLQFLHVSTAFALRYCQFSASNDLGGAMLDLWFVTEIRSARDSRTALRVGWGLGQDTFNGGRTQSSTTVAQPNVDNWLIGIRHELPTRGAPQLLLTLDAIIPQSEGAAAHRSALALQFGVSIRGRAYHAIRTLPGGR